VSKEDDEDDDVRTASSAFTKQRGLHEEDGGLIRSSRLIACRHAIDPVLPPEQEKKTMKFEEV